MTVKSGSFAIRVKGFIVATRFATESQPRVQTCIFAEDPESPGELPFEDTGDHSLGNMVIRLHYGGVASKLNQPVLAAALMGGFVVPEEIRFPVMVWQFQIGPLEGVRIVGGYFPSPHGALAVQKQGERIIFTVLDPFRLDVGRGTFFGVEESMFRQLITMVRLGVDMREPIRQFEKVEPFYSAITCFEMEQ